MNSMTKILAGKGLETELATVIAEAGAKGKGTISYLVTVLDESGELRCVASQQEETVHASASMIKVLILAAVLRGVTEEQLQLDSLVPLAAAPRVLGGGALQELNGSHKFTILELCRLMIVLSDNWATNLLIRTIGMTYINETAKLYGLKNTELKRYMMDTAAQARGEENTTTALDLTRLYAKLYELREDSIYGHELWQILRRQQFRDKIPFHWGEEVPFFHKTGCLDRVEHDGGILPLLTGTFGIVILISDMANDEAIPLEAAMGRTIKTFLEDKLPL